MISILYKKKGIYFFLVCQVSCAGATEMVNICKLIPVHYFGLAEGSKPRGTIPSNTEDEKGMYLST